jgi:hypothetical protein
LFTITSTVSNSCSASPINPSFARWIDEPGLRAINNKLIALLAGVDSVPLDLALSEPINFQNIYFDSTCLKAPIHYPVDWVLLRNATRTLMKATVLIRDFMGKPTRAKGFAHRALMVGWAVLSHNLWVLAPLEQVTPAAEVKEVLPEAA